MEDRQRKCCDLLGKLPGFQITLTFVPLNNGTPNKSGAMIDIEPYVLARLTDHANTIDVTQRAAMCTDDVVDYVIVCVLDKADKLVAERAAKKIAKIEKELAATRKAT